MHTYLLISAIFFGLLTCIIYIWQRHNYSYWQRHHIRYIKPLPFLGNLKELLLLRLSFGDLFRQLYADPALVNAPIAGFYVLHTPALLIRDPDLIKLILIKNFNEFLNRYEAADAQFDAFGALTLPLAKYPVWRESRRKISALFTSGKLREQMYPKLLEIATELELHMARSFAKQSEFAVEMELKEMCALYTTDVTAKLLYGIDACSLQHGDSEMRQQCRELLEPNAIKALHFFTIFFLPQLTGKLRAKVFTKQFANFMRQLVDTIKKHRKRRTREEDLIELLIKLQVCSKREAVTLAQHPDFIAAQAAIFLLAGFETSSSAIAFTLYELSKQPKVQARLRQEIKLNLKLEAPAQLSYERIMAMPYLQMVVAEALRLYPAAAFINRECTPALGQEGFSLKPRADFTMPQGMPAYISILGLHRDAKYWPNPDHFDPERFSSTNITSIHPMTYIPFGAGPHGCVGSRLGLLQVKVALVYILKEYSVETCSRTVHSINFDPKRFMLEADSELYLKFVREH